VMPVSDQQERKDRYFENIHPVTDWQGDILLRSSLRQVADHGVDILFLQDDQWGLGVPVTVRFQGTGSIGFDPTGVQTLHFGVHTDHKDSREDSNDIEYRLENGVLANVYHKQDGAGV
jgi:hypothetical protein